MPQQEVPVLKQLSNKIIFEVRFRAVEVEVLNIRRKIEMLPPHHEVSWGESTKNRPEHRIRCPRSEQGQHYFLT